MTRKDLFWKLAYLVIAGGMFMIDQMTKAWAARRLRFDGDLSVIPNFLNFAYAQNPGVAFSMFDQQGDSGRWSGALRLTADGPTVVATPPELETLYDAWEAAFELYRQQIVV